MPSHLSDLGFKIGSPEDFEHLGRVTCNTKPIKTKEGQYHVFSPNAGIEMWAYVKDNKIEEMTPFYLGKSCFKATFYKITFNEGTYPMVLAEIDTMKDSPTDIVPINMDLADYWLYDDIEEDKKFDVNIAFFAESIHYFDTEDEFIELERKIQEEDDENKSFAPNYFIGSGSYAKPPESRVLFGAKIISFRKILNLHHHEEFYWIYAKTQFGYVDIIADLKSSNKKPKVGGLITGQFYATARIAGRIRKKKNIRKFLATEGFVINLHDKLLLSYGIILNTVFFTMVAILLVIFGFGEQAFFVLLGTYMTLIFSLMFQIPPKRKRKHSKKRS